MDIICLKTANIISMGDGATEIICGTDCIYYGACNDDFRQKISKIKIDIPDENLATDENDFNEEGFQTAFEESDIVKARQLYDADEQAEAEARKEADKQAKKKSKKSSAKTSDSNNEEPKTTKKKTDSKDTKPKKSAFEQSLGDIVL